MNEPILFVFAQGQKSNTNLHVGCMQAKRCATIRNSDNELVGNCTHYKNPNAIKLL